MPTGITNLSFVEKAQKEINSVQGFADSTKPFALGFNSNTLYGNAVAVPVFSAGTAGTAYDFATDGSSTTTFTNITVNTPANHIMVVPSYQYAQLTQYGDTSVKGAIDIVLNKISDAGYAAFNTTNWPLVSNKVISSAWSEATPTLAALEVAVQAAIATKKLNRANIIVLMPSGTYAVIKALLNSLNRDIKSALGYDIVPVYAAGFNQTAITDGSAVGIAIGQDIATPEVMEEFEFLVDAESTFGIGFHKFGDAKARSVTIALSAQYGVSKLNATGFKWVAAS